MASVELRAGDTLNIVWTSVQDTPLGVKEVESSFAFSYEELLTRLKTKGRLNKSRRSGSDGARFSRIVALSSNALRKGKWSTGADIDRSEVFAKLIGKFNDLDSSEYVNITSNAKKSISTLYEANQYLDESQRQQLSAMAQSIGLET